MTTSGTGVNPRRERLFETVCLYVLMAGFAVFTTIVGAVLFLLIEEFALPYSRGGDFMASQNLGCFVGILLSGFIIDRYRKRDLVLVCYAAFSLTIIAIYLSSTLSVYLLLLALAGLTSKILDALLNARIAELHVENKGFYMNLLHCCYGIGSFLGPVYAGGVVKSFGGWRPAYLLLGGACLLLAILYGFFTSRQSNGAGKAMARALPDGPVPSLASLRSVRMLLCWLILFCYCGHQIGMNNWFPGYMQASLGTEAMRANFGLSLFWLGLIAGRLSCSILTRHVYEKHLLATGNAFGGLALLVGVSQAGEWAAFSSAILAGLFAGATIPMVLTLAYTWNPGAQGKVSMVMFIGITIGGAVGPWVMGKLVRPDDFATAMYLNGTFLLATAVLCCLLPGENSPVLADPDV